MSDNADTREGKEDSPEDQRGNQDRRKNKDRRPPKHQPGREKTIHDGGFVFREHESAQEAFIVKSGTVEIFKSFVEEGHPPREVVLGSLSEGAMFGEMALIDDQPRMASARAVGGAVVVYVISREQFNAKLEGTNLFICKLLQILAGNVRSSSEKAK